ncbi:MFS transporter [Alicyclobacillus tolerans]|uniref:MFS family permease n=1 Tax=Alicyclobacillus tolerans TaxID=90970 RepID=A0ABT9LU16_9BACL|nr:MFS transporter [Alicyclobacillus tengchongensis]MDP9727686.1 MFS family permease [Alicyclobacillus tengchongensis]
MISRPLMLYLGSETLLSLGIGMAQYALPFFYAHQGLTDARIGVLFSINALCGAFVALLLGGVADRLGASKVWKLATLIIVLGYLGIGLGNLQWVYAVCTALAGIGGSLLVSTENVVLSSLTVSSEKAHIFSRFVAMYMFCMGAGNVVAGFLSPILGFRHVLLLGTAIALIAPVIRLFVRAPDAKAHRAFRKPSRRIIWMSGFSFLFGLAPGLLSQFMTLVLHQNFGGSPEAISIVSALAMFMVSIGSATVGPLIRRVREFPTLSMAFALSAGTTAASAWVSGFWSFSGLYLVRTAASSIPQPIVDASFLRFLAETEYAQMFGVRVAGANLGSAVGSWWGGSLLSQRMLQPLLWLSAAFFFVAYVYIMLLLRSMRHSLQLSNQ